MKNGSLQLTFGAFDARRALLGLAIFLAIVAFCFVMSLWVSVQFFRYWRVQPYNQVPLSLLFSVGIGLVFTKIYGQHARIIWRITVDDTRIKIARGHWENEFSDWQTEFALADLQHIHLNGWFRENHERSYRWLRLVTERETLWLLIGNTMLIETANADEIEAFDILTGLLTAFAVAHDYRKTDLKQSYRLEYGKNFYYQKKKP